jgi:hypothetical protein
MLIDQSGFTPIVPEVVTHPPKVGVALYVFGGSNRSLSG